MPITSLFPRGRTDTRSTPPDPSATVDEIRALNLEYTAAVRARDDAWLGRYLADDAVVLLADGRRLTKAEFLGMLRDEPNRFRSLGVRDVTVRVFGATVQVDADAPWELTDGSTGVSRYIDTWVWLDGRWQVVSAQVTPLR
jgi:ketosteroid isomerase-like protein